MPSMSSEVGKIYVCLCQGLDSGRALFPASDSFMRIRFRASDYGQVAKTKLVRAANRNGFLVRNRIRRWCSGHCFFPRMIKQL